MAIRKGESNMKAIGKYQVIEDLGASATGKTFRVRDAFRNREFAAKILQVVPGLSAEAKEQCCAHLASCAELSHRQIAKVHDLGEVDEGVFVATEWRTGVDLRAFLPANRDLPLGQKLAIIAQVAEGLAFAHSRGIAHGNLKPSNIFVDPARDVSILDFGIAKWLAAILAAGARPEGLVAGYLAPEQVLGQPFDARSDIFALGVMLYEFASGKHPFSADPNLVPREIVHTEAEPLRKAEPQAPEELEQLVAKALKKDPAQRLQTAEEFASGLYLAAQQLRRAEAAAVVSNPPSTEPGALLLPAFTPELKIPQATPQAVFKPEPQSAPAPAPAATLDSSAAPAPPVRERPQDAPTEQKPWTSRSYAANTALPPITNTDLPKPPANPATQYQPPAPPAPTDPPAFQPPQSFLKPAAAPAPPTKPKPKPNKTAKRALTVVVGLILAAVLVGSLISRQNLRASQNKYHATTPSTEPAEPVAKPSTPAPAAPAAHVPKHEEPAPEEVVNPEVPAKQILNGPVRTLWESGRYAQALALVNKVLATDATNEDALSWKKKIREAQAAEAALK
jgi:serine/threonine protein kinase